MIQAYRFVANKAIDHEAWLDARRHGVTATEVSRAATQRGYQEVLESYKSGDSVPDNAYMEFGRRMEGPLSLWVKEQTDIMPNEWLISAEDPDHLATPDGLSLEHARIAEIKTSGKDLERIPIQYMRQVQWQLYVTDASECAFVWMLRAEARDGTFVPAWIEPKHTFIGRDEDMISELRELADRLWVEKRRALHG